jgi:hypothetical protein
MVVNKNEVTGKSKLATGCHFEKKLTTFSMNFKIIETKLLITMATTQ